MPGCLILSLVYYKYVKHCFFFFFYLYSMFL